MPCFAGPQALAPLFTAEDVAVCSFMRMRRLATLSIQQPQWRPADVEALLLLQKVLVLELGLGGFLSVLCAELSRVTSRCLACQCSAGAVAVRRAGPQSRSLLRVRHARTACWGPSDAVKQRVRVSAHCCRPSTSGSARRRRASSALRQKSPRGCAALQGRQSTWTSPRPMITAVTKMMTKGTISMRTGEAKRKASDEWAAPHGAEPRRRCLVCPGNTTHPAHCHSCNDSTCGVTIKLRRPAAGPQGRRFGTVFDVLLQIINACSGKIHIVFDDAGRHMAFNVPAFCTRLAFFAGDVLSDWQSQRA